MLSSEEVVTSHGDVEEYHALFNRVSFLGSDGTWSRSHNWKSPLRVVVEEDEAEMMEEAILHYVGGVDVVECIGSSMVLIESDGYYEHIGY